MAYDREQILNDRKSELKSWISKLEKQGNQVNKRNCHVGQETPYNRINRELTNLSINSDYANRWVDSEIERLEEGANSGD